MRDTGFEVCDDNMTRLLFLHARWHCDGTVSDLISLFWDILPINAERDMTITVKQEQLKTSQITIPAPSKGWHG